MKAITIHQPYADLIMSGDKWIENRSWYTNHRGPLLIHAAKTRHLIKHEDNPEQFTLGAILGVVNIVHCVSKNSLKLQNPNDRISRPDGSFDKTVRTILWNKHCEGPYLWLMHGAVRFEEPIFVDGKQRLWSYVIGASNE